MARGCAESFLRTRAYEHQDLCTHIGGMDLMLCALRQEETIKAYRGAARPWLYEVILLLTSSCYYIITIICARATPALLRGWTCDMMPISVMSEMQRWVTFTMSKCHPL